MGISGERGDKMVAKYLDYDCLYVTDHNAIAALEEILESEEVVESATQHTGSTKQQRTELFNKISGSL